MELFTKLEVLFSSRGHQSMMVSHLIYVDVIIFLGEWSEINAFNFYYESEEKKLFINKKAKLDTSFIAAKLTTGRITEKLTN